MTETKKSAWLDSSTKIIVALISGAFLILGTFLGFLLERYDVLQEWIDPPVQLIADFDSENSGLSPITVSRRSNTTTFCDVKDGKLVIENDASVDFKSCKLTVMARESETLFFDDLGSLVADLSVNDANELEESNLYLEMVTYFDGAQLEANCGIRHVNNELTAYMTVRTLITDQASNITCPESAADMDGSDGICETFYTTIQPLQPDEVYTFELRANPAATNEFQCFVGNNDTQFFVNTQSANMGTDLTLANFERYIIAGYSSGSTVTYTVDNVYQIR